MCNRGERRRRTENKIASRLRKIKDEVGHDRFERPLWSDFAIRCRKDAKTKGLSAKWFDRDPLDVRSWDRNPNNDLPMKDEA